MKVSLQAAWWASIRNSSDSVRSESQSLIPAPHPIPQDFRTGCSANRARARTERLQRDSAACGMGFRRKTAALHTSFMHTRVTRTHTARTRVVCTGGPPSCVSKHVLQGKWRSCKSASQTADSSFNAALITTPEL